MAADERAASVPRTLAEVFDACRGVRPVYVAAPMVRYSRLPFRLLVREYGADLCYTPMVMADCFVRSPRARDVELQLDAEGRDRPLVVQFAATSAAVFAQAAALVAPHVAAVDLNTGCPQRWAVSEGIGCALMRDPERVADMVRAARNATVGAPVPVGVKMRVYEGPCGTCAEGCVCGSSLGGTATSGSSLGGVAAYRQSVEYARALEAAGVSFLAVHGRTPTTKSSAPVDVAAIRAVCASVSVPVIANGDVCTRADADALWSAAGGACAGAMSARGLLDNPALFAGHASVPAAAVERFLALSHAYGSPAPIVQHHVARMCAAPGGPVGVRAARDVASMASASLPALADWWRRERPCSL